MKGIRSYTRVRLIKMELGQRSRFTVRQMAQVLVVRQFQGWLTAFPADGPAYGKIVMVHQTNPFAEIVLAHKAGTRWFEVARLEKVLGCPISSSAGVHGLTKAGFGMLNLNGDQVELHIAEPAKARMVNESRCVRVTRGYSSRAVIEAFYAPRAPGRVRVNLTPDRRQETLNILRKDWGIDCPDLLTDRRRVRLISSWQFPRALQVAS